MGNQHSAAHAALKPRKNVHWKSAGRPAVPGKPEIIPILSDDEPNAITLRWSPPVHDGGAPLHGYQVECNRLGTPAWIRTAPPVVLRPELVLTGLEPPHRYQFRVAALNAVGRSEYSELSDVLTVSSDRGVQDAPTFHQHLEDITALENDKTEFRVSFSGLPQPSVAWFKDGYEIFSSRRTAITTNESSSVLVFYETLATDEGEIKCTITNRLGHTVTKARLLLEAAPKLRYPRQYEDGLLYEINETVFLKTSFVGKPIPSIEWRHDGQPLVVNERIEITNTPKFSLLKIHSARRSDRGEYQIHASNNIGEDTAAFLVTITAPPDPPRRVSVIRQVDKSVTLDWEPPEDDGGCRIGNYVVEYYRNGWNVWLKATTSRKTNITLFDLIEGSEYRFRVKAESPYGMSAPSMESSPVRIPGRAVDMEFLAVESRIINDVLLREDGEEASVSPAPRRKRMLQAAKGESAVAQKTQKTTVAVKEKSPIGTGSTEFMLVLYPDSGKSTEDKTEKRKSFQLDLEDALSPPPISLSAPELSSRCMLPFKALRNSVSSTELLHEYAMARFYKAVAMKEEQKANNEKINKNEIKNKDMYHQEETTQNYHIPHTYNTNNDSEETRSIVEDNNKSLALEFKAPEIFIKTDSIEGREYKYNPRQPSQDSEVSEGKWHNMSFEEDYTASTVSTDEELSDEGSLNGDTDRRGQYSNEEDTYNPRGKPVRPSPVKEVEEEDSEIEVVRPVPLPNPNFIPKPILKRREADIPEVKQDKSKKELKPKKEEKAKKEEKMTIFKKITKMPIQKPFSFPKILKKESELPIEEKPPIEQQKNTKKVEDKTDYKENDEGRTIIEYYGNIVKEYGSNKKPVTPLYLNTDDLKTVAEKQEETKKVVFKNKTKLSEKNSEKQNKPNQLKQVSANSVPKQDKLKPQSKKENPKLVKKKNSVTPCKSSEKPDEKFTQQIILKKTERATIIIPIDYQGLEEQARMTVRSAIDYMVDICLLVLAFWVYFFKDERLAIPFLVLIIYRQLQETLLFNIPQWVRRHTPTWLKSKKS